VPPCITALAQTKLEFSHIEECARTINGITIIRGKLQVFPGFYQRVADFLDGFGLIDGLDWALSVGVGSLIIHFGILPDRLATDRRKLDYT